MKNKLSETECIRRGKRTILTSANSRHLSELSELHLRNQELHKPWVHHGELSKYFEKISAGRAIGLFLWDEKEQALIGVINMNEPVAGGLKSAYLGYYLDTQVAGRGYMFEGISLALDYAFKDLDFHRLEANIQPGNERSIALVKRLGFRLEGFSPKYLFIDGAWCDHERWAILIDEWQ